MRSVVLILRIADGSDCQGVVTIASGVGGDGESIGSSIRDGGYEHRHSANRSFEPDIGETYRQ